MSPWTSLPYHIPARPNIHYNHKGQHAACRWTYRVQLWLRSHRWWKWWYSMFSEWSYMTPPTWEFECWSSAQRRAASYGAKVALIETNPHLGGTCVNVGAYIYHEYTCYLCYIEFMQDVSQRRCLETTCYPPRLIVSADNVARSRLGWQIQAVYRL